MGAQHTPSTTSQHTQSMAMLSASPCAPKRGTEQTAVRPMQALAQHNALSPAKVVPDTTGVAESAFYFCYW